MDPLLEIFPASLEKIQVSQLFTHFWRVVSHAHCTCTVKLAGLRCVASSLGSLLVARHKAALSKEMEQFEQVSK